MAHFAETGLNNKVLRVIVVSNADCGGGEYPESEPIGAAFCRKLFGGIWVQTSYNHNFRKRYAGIGYTFDVERDAFIPPKPYPSWILDEVTCSWQAPIPVPYSDKEYLWNEEAQSWDEQP
jgi:hypothetical protein